MNYPLSEAEFRMIYAKVPRLCVDLVIRQNGRVLLTKRKIDPYLGHWHLPGGTIYFGETLEQAAKRVAKDELGVEVSVGIILTVACYLDEYKDGWHGWPFSIAVKTDITKGEMVGSEQAEEFAFFTKLPSPMVKVQREFLTEKLGFQEQL